MSTAFFTHPDCLEHTTPDGHPEQVARLEHINAAIKAPAFAALDRRDAPVCNPADILLAHPQTHLDKIIQSAPQSGYTMIDGDTHMSPGSLTAAYRAVGGNIAAVDAVLTGQVTNAFVACRPPGHHAEKTTAMGFCLFGNIAIAAKHALERHGLDRVAIIDFDVHHGNGTQDLLWDEPRCLFASSHQSPLYPGTGTADETGVSGNILNAPLAAMSGSKDMRRTYEMGILPAIRQFNPQLILISAGFDAHMADPLAQLNWSTEDYTWLARQICDLADDLCDGRIVSTLEGGYDLQALAASTAAHVSELMKRG